MGVRGSLAGLVALLCLCLPAAASAARVQQDLTFTASDGTRLHAVVGGEGDLSARPLIVEFSPYAPSCCGDDFGPAYNNVQVHARGTGRSHGTWTAVGPRDQQDVSEFLAWACKQPWSNGHIGLYGFSASAIAIYNSLHLPLACVDAASLMAGTADLYRDLLYPGGMLNAVPGAAVGAAVGGLLLSQQFARLGDGTSPVDSLSTATGLLDTVLTIMGHPTEDGYWLGHTQRPGPNTFPILADTSFYDPEARGPFESFQLLRKTNPGTHLLMDGAHDGYPKGVTPFSEYRRWFDHYVRGLENGVDRDPAVQLLLGNGSRERLLGGDFTRLNATDWPVPGTTWRPFFLDPAHGGTLGDAAPTAEAEQSYPAIVSVPTATDPHTTAALGPGPSMIPPLTDMTTAGIAALTYTTGPFAQASDLVGPASLDVFLSSTSPETDIHAVVADVWLDGSAHPIGQGRLRSTFPDIDRSRSLISGGDVVQPYGDYSHKTTTAPFQRREYHVEFWPVGNHLAAGHRVRLYLVGTAATQLPATPGVNTVSLGGATPSRLLLPIVPADAAGRTTDAGVIAGGCVSRRRFTIRLLQPRGGDRLKTATVTVAGKRVPVVRRGRWHAVVDLRGRTSPKPVVVRVTARTRTGRKLTDVRTYRPCRPGTTTP